MKALVFEAPRDAYRIEDVTVPLTVVDLREMLEDLDDDLPVILSHDSGYTYGSLRDARIMSNESGEWEDYDYV